MRRREFITLLGGAAAMPFVAQAQQPGMALVGLLSSAQLDDRQMDAVRHGLKYAGYIEGRNLAIKLRSGVMAVVGDALSSGVVPSLARPGGNVTGLTFFNPGVAAKRLELLKEIMPNLTRVGVLLNLVNPMNELTLPRMRRVAGPLKLELEPFDVRAASDLEGLLRR
jgi:putative ABC transport system substrate-binding protein